MVRRYILSVMKPPNVSAANFSPDMLLGMANRFNARADVMDFEVIVLDGKIVARIMSAKLDRGELLLEVEGIESFDDFEAGAAS